MLTIFYDGLCPLCNCEINYLKAHNANASISFVDINEACQLALYPRINYADAQATLHAIDDDGKLLLGLDANVAAWSRVGKMQGLKILRWPLIRCVADYCYRVFAKHRTTIAQLLMPKQCASLCQARGYRE